MPGGHHHRSGPLKQANKRNKRSKASKRSIAKSAGGKVASRLSAVAGVGQQSKADRKNNAAQIRKQKKEEMMRRKRGIDSGNVAGNQLPPPKIVGILALGEAGQQGLDERMRDALIDTADKKVYPHSDRNATVTAKYDMHKKDGYLTVLTCRSSFAPHYENEGPNSMLLAALDLARICDLLVIAIDGNSTKPNEGESHILSMEIGGDDDKSVQTNKTARAQTSTASQRWDHLINAEDDQILSAIKAQGLPSVLTVLAHTQKEAPDQMTVQSVKSLRRSAIKRRLDLKRYVARFATTEFGNNHDRVVEVDLAEHEELSSSMMDEVSAASPSQQHTVGALVRTICGMAGRPATWISNSPRNYIVGDQFTYDPISRQFLIQGYVRGVAPLDVNSLVHIPCMGTFRCASVQKISCPITPQHRLKKDANMVDENSSNILTADPEYQENLEMFATPDSLAGEQNLIGFDEAEENGNDDEEDAFARPAGWSDYQAAWLDGVDNIDNTEEFDHGELAAQLNMKTSESADIDMLDANQFSEEERKALIEQRRKEQSEHAEFPDEVQVGDDEKARDRFARYRSLKSFRKSYWDPKENLPDSYASLFHFSSFKATQRAIINERKESTRAAQRVSGNFFGKSPEQQEDAVMSDDEEDPYDPLEGCVPTGTYIALTLSGVPEESVRLLSPKSVVTAVTLLSHENKMSVLHAGLTTPSLASFAEEQKDLLPVKSKDVIIFRCGWRTWSARPIFSQNNLNCDKHKFERYRPDEGFYAASWFGPVTYSPCPVLAFRKTPNGRLESVAHGSLMSADADRIIVKRIILTGYPVKVRKRHAVVKYMFNNPEDVMWFKPAGLHTKHGLIGNIEESVGDHGTMKCLFHAPIKQHDTVCLPLYKRIYPKYAPTSSSGDEALPEVGTVATAKQPRILIR
jgi:pre-rRNA-processing protein TSR1